MRAVCRSAAERGVTIGAQVGYQDLPGFGRRFIDIEPEALTQEVIYQVGALQAFARVAGSRVSYVKPHGALYNAVVHHLPQAKAVIQAIRDVDDRLPVLGLPGSMLLEVAERGGLRGVPEAFADPPAADLRAAWLAWAAAGGLPADDVPACELTLHGARLAVAAPARLADWLGANRPDAARGEAWVWVGGGPLRRAAVLTVTAAG